MQTEQLICLRNVETKFGSLCTSMEEFCNYSLLYRTVKVSQSRGQFYLVFAHDVI